ncbi:boule [Echinococcus multilocularis]|uniref:Boule n=1 Tax=Echinococcus multilocularis TaxID=6211 RepID=A0A068YIA2_ECHMU|nr:boule [Echinococcus multilocularis]
MNPLTIQTVPSTVTNVVVPKIGTLIPNRIFVGGITSTTTEDDLRTFFGKFGQVKDVKIISDRSGLSKGNYGFVTFEHQDTAERIIKNEGDSLVFNDRKLNIGHAVRKQSVFQRQYENGALSFSNSSISCTMTNGVSYIPVTNQAAQISTNNLLSPTVILPQQSTSSIDYEHQISPVSHHSGASVLQVPLNSSTLQRDQCPSYPDGANFIPAGAILFTNTPVIIPNTGLANGNAIEVLYAPQIQAASLSQPKTTSNFHIQGLLPRQHQYNSPCFHEVKSQDYAALAKDVVRQRIQASKQQQEEVHQNEMHSSLFQQDLSAIQRSAISNISLLQKLLVSNGAVGENSASLRTSEQYLRNVESSTDSVSYLDESKCASSSMSSWSLIGSSSQAKVIGGNDTNRTRTKNDSTSPLYVYRHSSPLGKMSQNEQLGAMDVSQAGRRGSTSENSNLFHRWPPSVDPTNSQVELAEDSGYMNSILKHLQYGLSNQVKSLDLTEDQNKLPHDTVTFTARQDTGLNSLNSASASGDTSFRHLQ